MRFRFIHVFVCEQHDNDIRLVIIYDNRSNNRLIFIIYYTIYFIICMNIL